MRISPWETLGNSRGLRPSHCPHRGDATRPLRGAFSSTYFLSIQRRLPTPFFPVNARDAREPRKLHERAKAFCAAHRMTAPPLRLVPSPSSPACCPRSQPPALPRSPPSHPLSSATSPLLRRRVPEPCTASPHLVRLPHARLHLDRPPWPAALSVLPPPAPTAGPVPAGPEQPRARHRWTADAGNPVFCCEECKWRCYARRPTPLPAARRGAATRGQRCDLRSRTVLPWEGSGAPVSRWWCPGAPSPCCHGRCLVRGAATPVSDAAAAVGGLFFF